jgi:hypothetical protein
VVPERLEEVVEALAVLLRVADEELVCDTAASVASGAAEQRSSVLTYR